MGVLDRIGPVAPARGKPLTIHAVILDMDGTLLDTETMYREAFMAAAQAHGLPIPSIVYESLVGIATCERGAILRRRFGAAFPWEALRDTYYAVREARARDGLRLKPGVAGLLRHIDRLGLAKAIATTASRRTAEAHLQATGLWARFEAVVTRDDVSRGKPYPDAFAEAAKRIGVPARLCLAIEDTEPGITSAWLAGTLPLMVGVTGEPPEAVRSRCMGAVADLNQVRALLGG